MAKTFQQSGSAPEATDSLAKTSTAAASSTADGLPVAEISGEGTIADGLSPVPTPASSPGEFPVYLVAAAAFFALTSTFLYFLCRCLARRKKRERQLSRLTPIRPTDPRMAGVRADQPIEFVVPTTVAVVSETTEESVSETDYSSGGCARTLAGVDGRRRRSGGFQINPADLQRGLYVGVTSVPGSSLPMGDLGKIGFSLGFDPRRSRLTVQIIGARNLPVGAAANPYAKLVLLPDRTTRYTTRVPRNASCPLFDESFAFCVRRDELPDRRLKISVWNHDRFSRKCLIGRVVYRVGDALTVDATGGEIWADLRHRESQLHENNGEVLLSLCYDPDPAVLTLTVLKVRGLDMQPDKGKETSVYSKVTLYVRRKMVRTKKTPSRRKAPEVSFNSPFSIHVPRAALREVDLTVALCEKWPLGGKRALGRTQAGANCLCDQGLQHWQDMLSSPKSTCAQWHVLCG